MAVQTEPQALRQQAEHLTILICGVMVKLRLMQQVWQQVVTRQQLQMPMLALLLPPLRLRNLPITASTTSTAVLCNGDPSGTATVTANRGTTPYTYLWNNAQTTQTATNLTAANYSVTVTDPQTCSTIATVTVTQPPVTASAVGTNPLCNGAANGTATATGGGGIAPLTYLWSNGQATGTATFNSGYAYRNSNKDPGSAKCCYCNTYTTHTTYGICHQHSC